MQTETRHNPGFALARVTLSGGETVRIQAGAMVMHSDGLELEAKMEGGLVKSLKRSVLGGESLFVSKYTAPAGGGWVDVAATLPGDAFAIDVTGEYFLTRGAYLASSDSLELDTKWGGFKNLVGGEGGFLVHVTGTGQLVAGCYGAADRHQLAAGEKLIVDSGHLVAYSPGIEIKARKAAKGMLNTLKSGEDLVYEMSGPGEVITQSRNPAALESWIVSLIPTQSA